MMDQGPIDSSTPILDALDRYFRGEASYEETKKQLLQDNCPQWLLYELESAEQRKKEGA